MEPTSNFSNSNKIAANHLSENSLSNKKDSKSLDELQDQASKQVGNDDIDLTKNYASNPTQN